MTSSPDTVQAAGTITGAEATTADRATPASAGTIGGTVSSTARTQPRPAQKVRPDLEDEPNSAGQRFMVGVFVAIPLVALVAAIPLLWGWGLGWHDVLIALAFYWVSGLGVTVGYHRRSSPPTCSPTGGSGKWTRCSRRWWRCRCSCPR